VISKPSSTKLLGRWRDFGSRTIGILLNPNFFFFIRLNIKHKRKYMSIDRLAASITDEISQTQSIIYSVILSNMSDSQKDDRVQQLEIIVQNLQDKLKAHLVGQIIQ
jgi:hypothetical protein